jgi:hypothetical protein
VIATFLGSHFVFGARSWSTREVDDGAPRARDLRLRLRE